MDAKIVFSSFEELKIQDVSFTDPIRPNVIVVKTGDTPTPASGFKIVNVYGYTFDKLSSSTNKGRMEYAFIPGTWSGTATFNPYVYDEEETILYFLMYRRNNVTLSSYDFAIDKVYEKFDGNIKQEVKIKNISSFFIINPKIC